MDRNKEKAVPGEHQEQMSDIRRDMADLLAALNAEAYDSGEKTGTEREDSEKGKTEKRPDAKEKTEFRSELQREMAELMRLLNEEE